MDICFGACTAGNTFCTSTVTEKARCRPCNGPEKTKQKTGAAKPHLRAFVPVVLFCFGRVLHRETISSCSSPPFLPDRYGRSLPITFPFCLMRLSKACPPGPRRRGSFSIASSRFLRTAAFCPHSDAQPSDLSFGTEDRGSSAKNRSVPQHRPNSRASGVYERLSRRRADADAAALGGNRLRPSRPDAEPICLEGEQGGFSSAGASFRSPCKSKRGSMSVSYSPAPGSLFPFLREITGCVQTTASASPKLPPGRPIASRPHILYRRPPETRKGYMHNKVPARFCVLGDQKFC